MNNLKKFDDDWAPYAFTGNVLDVLNRLREASLPQVVDATVMTRIGVSEGNAFRTIAALQYLKLLDDEYNQTDHMADLSKATTKDYPSVLAGILRDAYSSVFEIVNPETATDIQIKDAFRGRKPKSQWKRMAILFIGLCQEAGIISGDPATIDKSSHGNTNEHAKSKAEENQKVRSSVIRGKDWYVEFERLFEQLPDKNEASWDKDTKIKWLKALEAMLDLFIEVED